jgi:hypothetical protein
MHLDQVVEQPLSAEELADRREHMNCILRGVMAEPDAAFVSSARSIGSLSFAAESRAWARPPHVDTRPRRPRPRYGKG